MAQDREQIVLDVIARVSGVHAASLERDTELVGELGIDSPKALHMLIQLEDRLGVEIGDDETARLRTVGDVLDALARLA